VLSLSAPPRSEVADIRQTLASNDRLSATVDSCLRDADALQVELGKLEEAMRELRR